MAVRAPRVLVTAAVAAALTVSSGAAGPSARVQIRTDVENSVAAQLERATPPALPRRMPYRDFLAQAIGLSALEPRPADVRTVDSIPLRQGSLDELAIRFDRPPVTTRALFHRHHDRSRFVFVALHGHLSNAERVIGRVPDPPAGDGSSTRSIGRRYYDRGWDVLAFDLTSDAALSSRIHADLVLWGTTAFGLWVRAICDTIDVLELRSRYERVVVWGLSNGGRIADQISVLCDPVSLVVVDDVIADQRRIRVHNYAETMYSQYSYYYLNAFLAGFRPADPVAETRSPKVYTRTSEYLEQSGLRAALREDFAETPLTSLARTRIVFKRSDWHAPEWQLLDAVLDARWSDVDGFALTPR